MMLTTALWLLLIVYLARMVFDRGAARALPPDWSQRAEREIVRLRGEVERLSGQVDRLEEEQSFLLRLLDTQERPSLQRGSSSIDRTPGAELGGRDRDADPPSTGDPNGHTRGH